MLSQKTRNQMQVSDLPPIPEKLYFTIGEVSRLCDLKPHVLRYWEQEFTQLSPSKRRGNRRYYQRQDVLLIREIKNLLYHQGFTIEGARIKLDAAANAKEQSYDPEANNHVNDLIKNLEGVLSELEGNGA